MQVYKDHLFNAFKNNHSDQLKTIHLQLNQMYYTILYHEDESAALNEDNIKKLKHIETEWMSHEKIQCYHKYDLGKEVSHIDEVEIALKKHPVYNHPLFSYLHTQADRNDLKQFLLNESVLNLEFFDYLALSIIGVSDRAKSEIIMNLWDEAGQGSIQKFHTTMFRKLLSELGIKYNRNEIIARMPWEGIAGINLFNYLSLYPFNKMTYFGFLAATEMLDPPHYSKLLKGITRIQGDQTLDSIYYEEHEKIDIIHASSWLQKIILPELAKKPYKANEFWLGFYLRLDSTKRYYDHIFNNLATKKAA